MTASKHPNNRWRNVEAWCEL